MVSTAYKPTVQQPMHNTKGNLTASQLADGGLQRWRSSHAQVVLYRLHPDHYVVSCRDSTQTRLLLYKTFTNLRASRRYFHQAVKHVKEGILA